MARWSAFAPTADRRLVKALHEGDEEALATLYDVYAERLYDYCAALLGDLKAAEEVVHDTLIDASRRAPRLRERERLRAWLYAAARRRCLLRKRPAAMADDEAFARLDFFDREVLFLVHRHDLTGEDLAAALGITTLRAQRRLHRATQQSPEAETIVGAVAVPEPPAALRHRVLHAGTDPELAGYRTEIAARGGALTAEGMPRQPDAPSRLARRWAFASGGSVAALATAVAVMMFIGPNVAVPDLQWPGGGKPRTGTPATRTTPPRGGPVVTRPPAASRSQGQTGPETGPQLMPSPTPTRPHRPPKSPTKPPTGVLAVAPLSVHIQGRGTIGEIGLTAQGGRVDWTAADSDPNVVLSNVSGAIAAGEHVKIQVILKRQAVTLPGQTVVTVTDGGGRSTAVTVSWDLSVF
ncbi:RNA polymerase sigma factor [Actinoallomurus rhizosphaericola]|uniref:RNA polymerase sigma factor n=1 Tax=Actinoallomurus rhizosphaericola TaxID=2952536 RepID=UPI0020929F3C|nr:sigma-70 family RNA polymerase sigma factor [Actinoallomurus rhizosphaericola]MCO5998513.1 sigma-70 family RNA polymerase sigma factor [Actinoallomurus rhizosphaericola]